MNLSAEQRLHGLVVAVHTPFHKDGSLNPAVVEQQAAHFLERGILTVFIGGTTGESSSLTVEERLALAERWIAVVKGTPLRVVVHVGSNCLADSRRLAGHAEKLGAAAVAALAPSYFKPRSLEALIACCADVAEAAPQTPFYYYDIPSMTGVSFSMPDFLEQAPEKIPTLAGMKFTNPDLQSYQLCLRVAGGRWDLPFGVDEHLLGALAMGARGAVGSGFNFAGPVFQRLFASFARGDLEGARAEQFRGVRLVKLFSNFGYMAAAKATMERIGVPVGPPRLPNSRLTPEQTAQLLGELEKMEFFDWIR
jgi:N-acetylneuraminate lyase